MPNKTKSKRQLAIVKKPDTIGAVISAPKGTPIKPRADNKPRSLGAAQFALVLLIVEKIGPSEIPKSTEVNQIQQWLNLQILPYQVHLQKPLQFQLKTKPSQPISKQI